MPADLQATVVPHSVPTLPARQDYADAIGEARQAVQLAPDDANLQAC
jgi:hypothetical protein